MAFLLPLAAAAVTAGAGIYESNKQSDAINSAANTQASADQAAIGENHRQFDITQANLKPWLTGGTAALDQQLQLLGLGGLSGMGGGGPQVGAYNTTKFLADNPDVAAWVQAGHGDPNAPGPQTPDQAVNYWLQSNANDPRAINAPRYTAADVGAGGADAQQQAAIDNLKNQPYYQSLYRNGVDTIDANASATGGLRGGNIQRSLANFGSDTLATVIQQQLANLGGISGQGVTTATNEGQLGANSATTIGNLTVNRGGAQAGGILGSAAVGNAGLNSALAALLNGAGQSYAAYRNQPPSASSLADVQGLF